MSEHREEHLDLCAAYALGTLDEAGRRQLEAHLAEGCPQCEAALADFGAATVMLAASSPQAEPSAALKGKVMAAVRAAGGPEASRAAAPEASRAVAPEASRAAAPEASRAAAPAPSRAAAPDRGRVVEMRPRSRPSFASWGWAAAAAALAIATGISWNTASRLRTELDANRKHLAEVEQKLAYEQQWAAVVNAPNAKVVDLAATPDGAADLKARVTYDPATQRAVLVFENFKAPSGRDYELWAIRGATPAPASLGLIKADESGHAEMRLENVGDPATLGAFAVSLEQAGGSPNPAAPSGPVVMLGKLAS